MAKNAGNVVNALRMLIISKNAAMEALMLCPICVSSVAPVTSDENEKNNRRHVLKHTETWVGSEKH